MSDTTFDKVKKTTGDVMHVVGGVVQSVSERISDMQEGQRITAQIRALQKEREQCAATMVNLAIRMFDQGVFVDALLKPEYERIKEIDADIVKLEAEKVIIGKHPATEAPAEETPAETEPAPAADEPQP